MNRATRYLTLSLCTIGCLMCALCWFHTRPVNAQQSPQPPYDDGTFYISSQVDVDNSYNLYLDSYMEVDFDYDEDIDEIEVDADGDEDGAIIASGYDDGDDYSPAEVYGNVGVVPTGHKYGLESDGYACFDDGEGDCSFEYVGSDYGSVYVQSPPPLIKSLSTYSVRQGDQGTLIIVGTNLVENPTDQLTLNFSGGGAPFSLTGVPTASTAFFSYDFSYYPIGTYSLSVTNNEASSEPVTFTVVSKWPANACNVSASSQSGYSSLVSTGISGGGGITVSFSGGAYSAVSQTVSYGPFSTPSSIAASIAALITANYSQHGLTARAFGPNVVYTGTNTIGTVNHAITGSSITTTTSPTAESTAEMGCEEAPPTPAPICGAINPKYVLAVTNDSVSWIDAGMNHGRNVKYSLEYWPTSNGLGNPTGFPATVTEHLSSPFATNHSFTSDGPQNQGLFDDFLGSTAANQSGTSTLDRCFTVTSSTLGSLGHILSYDLAGKHPSDYIEITPAIKRTILNKWKNPDDSPKDISIP